MQRAVVDPDRVEDEARPGAEEVERSVGGRGSSRAARRAMLARARSAAQAGRRRRTPPGSRADISSLGGADRDLLALDLDRLPRLAGDGRGRAISQSLPGLALREPVAERRPRSPDRGSAAPWRRVDRRPGRPGRWGRARAPCGRAQASVQDRCTSSREVPFSLRGWLPKADTHRLRQQALCQLEPQASQPPASADTRTGGRRGRVVSAAQGRRRSDNCPARPLDSAARVQPPEE